MFTAILKVTNKNGSKHVQIDDETVQGARQKLTKLITELFGKHGGNDRVLKAVSTLVDLAENDEIGYVYSMQLSWDNNLKMWEISYQNWDDLTDRFLSFEGAIGSFCDRLFPTA